MSQFIISKNTTLLQALIENLGIKSATKARKLIKHGIVTVNDQSVVRADSMLAPGDTVKMASKQEIERRRAPFEILFEDADILIAVKPAGFLSVDRDNERSDRTFLNIVNHHVKENSRGQGRAFLVHRLDKEVSGIMIFAKSRDIQQRLQECWHDNEKLYQAIVEGLPPKDEGCVQSFLAETSAFRVYSKTSGPDTKLAITHYRVMKRINDAYTLVEVRLETGRKNQIRVHLSDIGCPIVGDKKYGAKSNPVKRIALHAFRFGFNHPVSGKRMVIESSLPAELKRLMPAI